LIFERQMMVRLSGDLDFGTGLGKQGDSEKENGRTAYASHERDSSILQSWLRPVGPGVVVLG